MSEEYIERDWLIDMISERNRNTCNGKMSCIQMKRMVESIPAADVVELVRCKDCVYYDFEKGCPFRESGYFFKGNPLPHENDFCSYGEKRDNND